MFSGRTHGWGCRQDFSRSSGSNIQIYDIWTRHCGVCLQSLLLGQLRGWDRRITWTYQFITSLLGKRVISCLKFKKRDRERSLIKNDKNIQLPHHALGKEPIFCHLSWSLHSLSPSLLLKQLWKQRTIQTGMLWAPLIDVPIYFGFKYSATPWALCLYLIRNLVLLPFQNQHDLSSMITSCPASPSEPQDTW